MRDKLKAEIATYDDNQRERVKRDSKDARNKEYEAWWSSEHKEQE